LAEPGTQAGEDGALGAGDRSQVGGLVRLSGRAGTVRVSGHGPTLPHRGPSGTVVREWRSDAVREWRSDAVREWRSDAVVPRIAGPSSGQHCRNLTVWTGRKALARTLRHVWGAAAKETHGTD